METWILVKSQEYGIRHGPPMRKSLALRSSDSERILHGISLVFQEYLHLNVCLIVLVHGDVAAFCCRFAGCAAVVDGCSLLLLL